MTSLRDELLARRNEPRRGLDRLGVPHETKDGGPLFAEICHRVEEAERNAGIEVISGSRRGKWAYVCLTEPQLRLLEKEIGRNICNSTDIIFGALMVGLVCPNDPEDAEYITDIKKGGQIPVDMTDWKEQK